MKSQNPPTAKELQELTFNYLDTLKSAPHNVEKSVVEIEITGGYAELSNKRKSLMAVF